MVECSFTDSRAYCSPVPFWTFTKVIRHGSLLASDSFDGTILVWKIVQEK
jgi:hypothetical protein